MVKFIEGSASSDVSGRMRELLFEALANSKEGIFLIVPDQFEFETEKAVYRILDNRELLTELSRIKVTTFTSLSRDILASAGENMPAADDVVKSVVMNKAVREQKNNLSVLKGAANRAGFCQRMVETVSALKTAGLTADNLDENSGLFKADGEKGSIFSIVKKLSDVGKIYKSYDALLSKYADSLDYTKKAAELISKEDNSFFGNSWVFVDCFNDFTGSQMEFIRRMISKAENSVFTFVMDTSDKPRENVFGRIFAQRDRIRGYAENEGLEVEKISEDLKKRHCALLEDLSNRLFSNEQSEMSPNGFCELVSARDVYEEADYAAAKIKQLCLDKGMLYRETAVLCADAECGKNMRDALERYDIPFFLDIPEPILYQPPVGFFISLLNALRSFTADHVLSCLKTGFYSKPNSDGTGVSAISNKNIDVFENYIFEWNLSAKHLKSEFKFAKEEDWNQTEAEEIRKAVCEPIIELRKELDKKDGAQITRLLYDFAANKVDIERAIRARCYGEDGIDNEALRVNRQIWGSLVEILEVLEKELKGENITLDEYYRLFTEICANTTLAKPPQFRDCVLVGDIDRTRADNVKAAFIIGASYDNLPAAASGMGIFSSFESELVTDLLRKNTNKDDFRAVSLKDFKEQYSLSLYRAYRALSLPSEFLSVSCPDYDASGNKLSRSTVFSDIKRVFKNITVINANELDDEFYCRSLKAIKQRYSMNLEGASPAARAMRGYLEMSGNEGFVQKLDEIRDRRGSDKAFEHSVSDYSARMLFKLSHREKDRLAIGATQVEKLMDCPFSYFCKRELGIRDKTKREFNPINRGNALHYVMEKVFTLYADRMDEFFKLKRADFLGLAGKLLKNYLAENTNGDSDGDRRTAFLFGNIASSAADLLISMQTELSVRSYRPQFFELNISNESENTVSIDTSEFNGNLPKKKDENSEEQNESDNTESEGGNKSFDLLSKPLSIKLDGETEIFVGGYLDRLDVMYAEKDSKPRLYLRVIDYKSRVKEFDKEAAKKGMNIQMLLYLTALCKANSENASIEVHPGEINYVSSKNAGTARTRLEALYLLETKLIPNGLYIDDEFIKYNHESVTERIISQIDPNDESARQEIINSINKSLKLNAANTATPDEFKKLTEECVSSVSDKLSKLYGGDVSAKPLIISNSGKSSGSKKPKYNPCEYCDFTGICGNANNSAKKGDANE